MALTIEEAREQVLEYLDDERGARYAPVSLGVDRWKKVDRALRSAQNRCIDDYAVEGGDRFNERLAITASATDGTVSLNDQNVLKIRGVLYAPGSGNTTIYRLNEGDELQTQAASLVERPLILAIIRRFDIPTTPADDDLLMGTYAGAARSWDAFDQWLCSRAALQLNTKDSDGKRAISISAIVADLKSSVIGHTRNPDVLPMPANDRFYWGVVQFLRWIFIQRTQKLHLILGGC